MFKQSIKEPLPASIGGSPSAAAGDSHGSSSGMLQYLQSWFPGWGGWYGYPQQTYEGEPFEGLLPDPKEQWNPEDILGMETQGLHMVWYLIQVGRKSSGPVLFQDSLPADVPRQQSLPEAEQPGQCGGTWVPACFQSHTRSAFASTLTVIYGKELWDVFCSSVCVGSCVWV